MGSLKKFGVKIFVLALLPALFVSCTKSGSLGGSSSSSGSFSGNISGSVSGGLSPISGATIALMQAGSSAPVTTAKTNTDGSYSLVFNNPGGTALLYLSVTGGNAGSGTNSNAQFLSIAGTTSSPISSLKVNELTTAAVEQVAFNFGILSDTNGTVTLSAPKNAAGATNVVTQFNNLISAGNLNTANANVTTSMQNGLKTLADAFAACIENASNCNSLFSAATTSSGANGLNILDSGVNAFNNSANNASSIYTLAFPLNSTTGFTLSSASMPSGFTFNNNLAPSLITVPVGRLPQYVAIDATGNGWVTNFSDNNVMEISPQGALLGTFSTGTGPSNLAIDSGGNVWITNATSNNVTELSSSGTTVGTFGGLAFNAISPLAIDASGNVWVPGTGGVNKLNSSGTLTASFAVGGSSFNHLAFDSSGNVWLTNGGGNNTLIELSSSGTLLLTAATSTFPHHVRIDQSGNLWVTNYNGQNVKKYSSGGGLLGTFTLTGTASLQIVGTAIDQSGNVWISSQGNAGTGKSVTELNSNGLIVGTYTSGGGGPSGIAIDSSGNIWVVNDTNNSTGNSLSEFIGLANGPMFFPYSGPIFPGD